MDNNQHRTPYPPARLSDQVDTYHGVAVPDPYRWLEDPDAPEARAWIEAENELTFGYLADIPQRDALRERLTALWDYEKYGIPFRRGGRYFYARNDGLQNQAVLYVAESLEAEPRVLLDPNTLSDDGTVALAAVSVSDEGSLMAYALAASGSDWLEWRVRDVATGEDREDRLAWSKFSGAAWATDGSGFYYNRYPEPEPGRALEEANYHQKVYFHRIGTPQSEDTLIYERPDHKEWMFGVDVTEDGRYLILHVSRDTGETNAVFVKDLAAADAPVTELLPDFDAAYSFITNDGPVLWFKTNRDAPRSRVIRIDLTAPEPENWVEVIPQADDTLQGVNVLGETVFAIYLRDAHSRVALFDASGAHRRDLTLPGLGAVAGFGGRREDTETFYAFTGFTAPPVIYRYAVETGESRVFRAARVDFDPERYAVAQVFVASKDGTRVPMFLVHRKGLERNGQNPAMLYGYGGFGASLLPFFSVANLVWLEMGGVYAMPNLRGGGEYGEEWHLAGTKARKQNVFDDFIAAAEWLIAEGYTAPAKLAISGGSNGGLLVGAAITQRPDLFGAALPAVGVMDMLRYHRFTIGWAWASDYGTVDDPDEFRALYAYSPLHNIRPNTAYPATLITTGDHDDRVVPAHSFKFAAALQAAQAGDAPILIRIDTKAGHGGGKPTEKIIEETADKYAFVVKALGMEPDRNPSGPSADC